MALHAQVRPFYYPPHAPFIFHYSLHHPTPPLPSARPPPLPPPPPSMSITTKMARAPPFIPHGSPPSHPTDNASRPPLLSAAPCTSMTQASFYLRYPSFHPPAAAVQPVPPTLLRQVQGSYFIYQSPLAPGPPRFPDPIPLYYSAAAGEGAAGGDPSTQAVDTETANGSGGKTLFGGRKAGTFFSAPRSRPRKCCWSWMTKDEAEKRRQMGSLDVRRSSGSSTSSSSSSPSFSDSQTASTFSAASAESHSPLSSLEFHDDHANKATWTTVMVKNIPNKYSREKLLKLLDDHCVLENKKLESGTLSAGAPPRSEYDFVYLPVDFRTNSCLGYAFVNFTSAAAAGRIHRALDSHKWDVFGSKKICHVCYARIQGKEALLANFWASSFSCDSDEFLPVSFSPPRSGAAPCPPPTAVGKRWPRAGSTNTPTSAAAAGGNLAGAAAATSAGISSPSLPDPVLSKKQTKEP